MKKQRPTSRKFKNQLRSQLSSFIHGEDYRAKSHKEFIQALSLSPDLVPVLDNVLDEFSKKKILKVKRGRYYLNESKKKVESLQGQISVHAKGFAFVSIPNKKIDDVFIPPPFVRDAFDGDTVEIKLLEKKKVSSKGPEGEVVKVIKRNSSRAVGTIYKLLPKQNALAYVAVFGREKPVLVKKAIGQKFKLGDRLLLKVQKWPKKRGEDIVCKFLSYLGHISEPNIDHIIAATEFGIPHHFSNKVKKDAKAFGKVVRHQDEKGRKNFAKLETFTIDPKTAKDYDDALSVTQDENGKYHLYVHIADVSHYVLPGTALDKEAFERGNSTYFPRNCFPMLPEELSNELCSLKEGVKRLAVTVCMHFDTDGELIDHTFHKSVIKSDKRFTYEEAKEVLDGKKRSKHLDALKRLVSLFHLLKKQKMARGTVDLAVDETVLIIDHNGMPTGVETVHYDITHQVIEECMLKANELVARELRNREFPSIFRTHEEPDKDNLSDFYEYARSLGFTLPPAPEMADVQKLFLEARGTPHEKQLTTSYIRSMKLATYSPSPAPHFGLALEDYTHFTSPIRRYVDLIVHRQLFDPAYAPNTAKIAKHTSETERKSFKGEMSVLTLKKLRYLKKIINENPREEFNVTVTKVKPFGIFFDIDFLGFEGFSHVSELGNEYFHYQDTPPSFIGDGTRARIFVGKSLKVALKNVDLIFQECDWKILEY